MTVANSDLANKGTIAEIKKTLEIMVTPGDVVELRIFDQFNRKYCGWFDDMDKMAAAALSHDSTAKGIYYFCNSCGDWYPEGKTKIFQAVA